MTLNLEKDGYLIVEKNLIKTRKVKTWTEEEDKLLKEFQHLYQGDWGYIATLINGRNANQCLHRYRRLIKKGTESKKIWSQQEDYLVSEYIRVYGKNWRVLSQKLKTKTGKQIRERFINKLDPEINRQPWSQKEDFLIINLYKTLGSRWSEISKSLVGRPENMVKNRFYSFITKNYQIKDKISESKETEKQDPTSLNTLREQEEIKFPSYTTTEELDDNLYTQKLYPLHTFDDMFEQMLQFYEEPTSFTSFMERYDGTNALLN